MKLRTLFHSLLPLAVVISPLYGCATAYEEARREIPVARVHTRVPSDIAMTPRAQCIQRELVARGADPSRLRVAIDKSESVVSAQQNITSDGPQLEFSLESKRVVHESGFNVVLNSGAVDPKQVPYVVSVNVTAYTPLTRSTSGVDEADLLFLTIDRNLLLAIGAVRATALIYAWDGTHYTVWSTAQSKANFYQVKDRRNLNAALRTGRATGGQGREEIEVSSVQDAGIAVVHHAIISAFSNALALNC